MFDEKEKVLAFHGPMIYEAKVRDASVCESTVLPNTLIYSNRLTKRRRGTMALARNRGSTFCIIKAGALSGMNGLTSHAL